MPLEFEGQRGALAGNPGGAELDGAGPDWLAKALSEPAPTRAPRYAVVGSAADVTLELYDRAMTLARSRVREVLSAAAADAAVADLTAEAKRGLRPT